MARRRSQLDSRLAQIVEEHVGNLVSALAQAVRENTALEIQAMIASGGGAPRWNGRARKRRILPCIAPNCRNPSKGPRFHYLCDELRGASKKDYEAWRKNKRERDRKERDREKRAA